MRVCAEGLAMRPGEDLAAGMSRSPFPSRTLAIRHVRSVLCMHVLNLLRMQSSIWPNSDGQL